jgi:hypothetical protein
MPTAKLSDIQEAPDKWAQYAAAPGGGTAKLSDIQDAPGGSASSPDDDWKVWQQSDDAGAPDSRNSLQRVFDDATESKPIDLTHGIAKAIDTTVGNFGGGALSLASPIVHPFQTAKMVKDLVTPQSSTERGLGLLGPAVVPAIHFGKGLVKALTPEQGETAPGYGARVGADALKALGQLVGGYDAAEVGGGAIAKIPTRARAGRLFESVMNDAGDQPVKLTRAMEPMERAQQLSARGGGAVGAVDNLFKRINTANPLDYREARDWASNLSRLSGTDAMNASPALKAQVGKLSHAFNEDIGDTAESVGRGDDYAKAMRNYRTASNLADAWNNAWGKMKKYAVPAALTAAGVSQAPRLVRAFSGQ